MSSNKLDNRRSSLQMSRAMTAVGEASDSAMSDRRPIFIVAPQTFSVRYLLGTDILTRLKLRGAPIVILSRNAGDQAFEEAFSDVGVVIELFNPDGSPESRDSLLRKFFVGVRKLTLPHGLDINTIEFQVRQARMDRRRLADVSFFGARFSDVMTATAVLLRRSRLLRKLFRHVESSLYKKSPHGHLFDKYDPSLVVVSDIGTLEHTNLIMWEARQRGVNVASVVLSWDNLTSFGMSPTEPDFAVAWNQNMRDELQAYHDIAASKIFIGGVALWDGYFADPSPITRDQFLQSYGLSPDRKTIFLGPNSPNGYGHIVEVVEKLLNSIEAGELGEPCQLLIRPHPVAFLPRRKGEVANEVERLKELRSRRRDLLAISYPKMIDQKQGAMLPIEDTRNLAAILRHSDVLVTVYSSLMIEACLFDLPTINVGFHNIRESEINIREVEWLTHIKRILDYGAMRTAGSDQELIDLIEMYLKDRSIDRRQRQQVLDIEAGPNKGAAGVAIADHLFDLANLDGAPRKRQTK